MGTPVWEISFLGIPNRIFKEVSLHGNPISIYMFRASCIRFWISCSIILFTASVAVLAHFSCFSILFFFDPIAIMAVRVVRPTMKMSGDEWDRLVRPNGRAMVREAYDAPLRLSVVVVAWLPAAGVWRMPPEHGFVPRTPPRAFGPGGDER